MEENTEQKEDMKGRGELTLRQQLFCDEYLVDFNGKQAVIRAGYSENGAEQTAVRLLSYNNVKNEIARKMRGLAERINISQDDVAQEMALIAYVDFSEFYDVDEETGEVKVKPLKHLRAGCSRAIKKIKTTTIKRESASGAILETETKTELELYDKNKALENLGRHLGMFNDSIRLKSEEPLPLTITFEVAPPVKEITVTHGKSDNQRGAGHIPKQAE